jgi:DNA-binding NarL/FixJ family response regulator
MLIDFCTSCPNRPLCNDLCPEAELYVKQDEIPQRELTIGAILKERSFPPMPWASSSIHFTKREKEILTLLARGLTRADIAQHMRITRNSLRQFIKKIKKKYAE